MRNPMQNPRHNNFINMPDNGIAIAARGVAKTYTGPVSYTHLRAHET